MNLLIKNGRVIDPSQKIDDTLDVLVENGLIGRSARAWPHRPVLIRSTQPERMWCRD